MALGSSAPEILLSVIEVCGHNFNAGELGPGTIVGSAAFNMLVIIGLCVSVIPDGKSRKIKHLRVFFITAFWSIFAYIWLYLILAVISPGIVENRIASKATCLLLRHGRAAQESPRGLTQQPQCRSSKELQRQAHFVGAVQARTQRPKTKGHTTPQPRPNRASGPRQAAGGSEVAHSQAPNSRH
ncbi:hypothetical protein CHARACLAT_028081 [Characodon lateralis]|uniref:Sodium/calcium exchanger membrane region domain-containing protein n=1 Tax=Characodon lateralis TaxID=208331 RepID=A0ABU7F6Q8_9TELE|nr:hypothetical protein [Characodon lateralis]